MEKLAVGGILLVILGWMLVGCRDLSHDSQPAESAQSIMETEDVSEEPQGELQEYQFTQILMAMPVELTVWASSEDLAQQACRQAFERLLDLEKIFSDYDPHSEINKLGKTAGEPIVVSEDLLQVLMFSQKMHRETQGAFDITARPLIELWREARKTSRLPSEKRLQEAMLQIESHKLHIKPEAHTVELSTVGVQLDLGGVAKGYMGDQALQVLKEHGLTRACYRAGGDMVLGEAPPHQTGWEVEVPGMDTLFLTHCGVAISGDTQQFVEIDGVRYSHVIDPRTGRGVTHRHLAVVIAPQGMLSDAWATAGCVLERHEFAHWLASQTGLQGWLIDPSGQAHAMTPTSAP